MMNTFTEIALIVLGISQFSMFFYFQRFKSRISDEIYEDYECYRRQLSGFLRHAQLDLKRKKAFYDKKLQGVIERSRIKGKVSEKYAENAFRLANAATLGLMHLQKTLAVRPAFTPRKKMVENEKIQKDVMSTLGGSPDYSKFDFLYPILGEEERELVDKAIEHASKYNGTAPEPKEG